MAESKQVKHVRWWHEAVVDWELENPGLTMNECASYFDVSPSYLSILRNSDAYKEYAERRRREHNSNVSETIIQKTEKLAKIAVDVLTERIDSERKTILLGGVKDTAEMALKSLGFGLPRGGDTRTGAAPAMVININASSEDIALARDRLRAVQTLELTGTLERTGIIRSEEGSLNDSESESERESVPAPA